MNGYHHGVVSPLQEVGRSPLASSLSATRGATPPPPAQRLSRPAQPLPLRLPGNNGRSGGGQQAAPNKAATRVLLLLPPPHLFFPTTNFYRPVLSPARSLLLWARSVLLGTGSMVCGPATRLPAGCGSTVVAVRARVVQRPGPQLRAQAAAAGQGGARVQVHLGHWVSQGAPSAGSSPWGSCSSSQRLLRHGPAPARILS